MTSKKPNSPTRCTFTERGQTKACGSRKVVVEGEVKVTEVDGTIHEVPIALCEPHAEKMIKLAETPGAQVTAEYEVPLATATVKGSWRNP